MLEYNMTDDDELDDLEYDPDLDDNHVAPSR